MAVHRPCAHLLFALRRESQDLGGFETTVSGLLRLLGAETVGHGSEGRGVEEKVVVN